MANHVLLDNVTHKDLRVRRDYARGGGYDVSATRAFPAEFAQLHLEYPLFFVKNADSGHFEAMALLGFSDAENLYLGARGWDARYIPMTIERQPFLIGFQHQVDEEGAPAQVPVVHIDLDHPSVNKTEGEPVFLPHGGESPFLERISSILMAIHQGNEASQSLSDVLVGLELIESLALEIEFKDGSRQTLRGLYTINEDKLRALGASGLEVLHKKNHLRDIYMVLGSLPNLERLIERKNQELSP